MRFVPLATGPGSPRKTIAGSVSNEPPPARTLMKPATQPTPASKSCSPAVMAAPGAARAAAMFRA
jgi:hypothetical protein